jgi:hypothetical protein
MLLEHFIETGRVLDMLRSTAALALTVLLVFVGQPSAAQECEKEYDSTFALIQDAIFARHGCTDAICHGAQAAGGLDLSPDVAYDNLIDVPTTSLGDSAPAGMARVTPGQKTLSLLWFNLAAATRPDEWEAPLRAMPIGLPPLSADELEAMRLWIEEGASRDGVVRGTDELLDACLPDPKPIVIPPLPPPPAGTGVQIRMPRWDVPPHGEDEVCFASYFDVTDQVPAEYRGSGGSTFRYYRNQIRQNPGSHHLIVSLYFGAAAIDDPAWGEFTCKNGPDDGKSCDPVDPTACAGDGLCGSTPTTSLACVGFGPADQFFTSPNFTGTQESSSSLDFPKGVFNEVPLKGVIIWNSHAFNLTDEVGPIDAWINFEFAEDADRRAANIFDTSEIFKMNVPPFSADEVCHHNTLPRDARLFELSSHMHQRGKRFRIFDGYFSCRGGPNDGDPCSPYGPDEDFETTDLCAGATCSANVAPESGDCNGDLVVSVDELVTGVGISLEVTPLRRCESFDTDANLEVSIDELVTAVIASLDPEFRDAEESLIYSSFVYNDPVTLRFDPPMEFPGTQAQEGRSLTYCALYDNGFTEPDEVKRLSTSPPSPIGTINCGAGRIPTGCTVGNVGASCSGNTPQQRDASCDSSPGAGDGFCDACRLNGGVTTEDEMFVLLGLYYVE